MGNRNFYTLFENFIRREAAGLVWAIVDEDKGTCRIGKAWDRKTLGSILNCVSEKIDCY